MRQNPGSPRSEAHKQSGGQSQETLESLSVEDQSGENASAATPTDIDAQQERATSQFL